MSTPFAELAAASLTTERFTFVDVGCAGGPDPAWRVFGDRLQVVGFDASLEECERLSEIETHPDVKYVGAFVGLPDDHPFARAHAAEGKPGGRRSPFPRFSAAATTRRRQERLEAASLSEKLEHNAWSMTRLADRDKIVFVPDVLDQLGWKDVDFLKIDIDGPDFQVLHSFDGRFDALGVLAARLEVNLTGGTLPTEHVFHNTDRFMRDRGFELFALDVRTYSMSALPSPFAITAPAQTRTGRPFQAEAYYARDPVGPDWSDIAQRLTVDKLVKLAAIFSLWNQPDSAAELLLHFRGKLEKALDVDAALDLLARQAQPDVEQPLSYADYIKEYEADSPAFYPPVPPPPPPPPTLSERIRAALRAFAEPPRD